MVSWPDLGTRVTVRYRRPAGSIPPLTDAVGHLLTVDPVVRVQTKTGAVIEFAPADVVALRVLTDAPVRTSEIRALEQAAAAAWPGVEQTWLDGWLLRAGYGATFAANSAVPLDISAHVDAMPAIVAWYDGRALTPWLAIPDRLLRLPPGLASGRTERVLVRDMSDVSTLEPDPSTTFSAHPDDAWLRLYQREIPVDVLTAVIDGELAFGAHPGGAVARAAVTDAPDGARWVGLSAVRAADDRSAGAPAARLCEALLAWGAQLGATRAYMRVHDAATTALAESLGFRLHHRTRYFLAASPGIAPDSL
jgi:N-acetylglutamate synthase